MSLRAVQSLQRHAGNRAVGHLLLQRRPGGPSLAKAIGNEEELEKGSGLIVQAKSLGGEEELEKSQGGCGGGCACATCGPSATTTTEDEAGSRDVAVEVERATAGAGREHDPAADLAGLAKAGASVAGGAAGSIALPGGVYGLTFPENVVPTISAKLNKAAGTWSPKVSKLRGNYSIQIRLLPGQTEITGPTGNTTQANHCDQATNLASLGNTVGNTWYVLKAVRLHENVHAAHFAKAMKKAEPGITAALEAVTVPTAPKMTAAQAVTALKGDAAYQAAVVNAQALWFAAVLVEVAGDHAAGGPCDKAEKKVAEPMRKKICSFAKKKKWPACAACP